MQIDARGEAIDVRVGSRFDALDVARLQDAVAALGPCSRLVIDFAAVRECDDGALALLASVLRELDDREHLLAHGEVAITGLTDDQWQYLTCRGLELQDAP